MWWLTLFILAPVRLRQENGEFKASLGYTKLWTRQGYRVRPCHTKQPNKPWIPFRLPSKLAGCAYLFTMLDHRFPGLRVSREPLLAVCLPPFLAPDLPTLGISDRDQLSLTGQAGNYLPPCSTWESLLSEGLYRE